MLRPRNLEVELNVDQMRLLYLFAHGVCIKLQCSLHDTPGDLHDASHSADRRRVSVHSPAFLHLLGSESWRSPVPSVLSLGPLQTCLYPLAGGFHLEGSLGQHHPAEELGCGAVIGGVDGFPDGPQCRCPAWWAPPRRSRSAEASQPLLTHSNMQRCASAPDDIFSLSAPGRHKPPVKGNVPCPVWKG